MIRLELTLKEAQQLCQCLSNILLTQADEHNLSEANETLQAVWSKLVEAEADATQPTQCLVCRNWFSQDKRGRNGHYCSAACKQKAYRQRRQAWRRQFRPARRT
jgi:hypothetical protein